MSVFVEQRADATEWYADTGLVLYEPSRAPSPESEVFGRLVGDVLARPRRAALLDRVVATEILPRLAMARRAAAAGRPVAESVLRATTSVDTEELVGLLLTRDAAAATAFIGLLQLRGATPESLYSGILSDAARRLGAMWEEDRCDFTQVTIGVGHLQQVARGLAPGFHDAAVRRPEAHRILLLPVRGEQHSFGLLLLAEFFRRAGWDVAGGPVSAGRDPADLVRDTWFDILGFSIGSDSLLGHLTKTIRRVRRTSCNRALGIMVGGPLFGLRPDLALRVGADAAAADAQGAVRQANGLLAVRVMTDRP
jgi:methanogenic corrinoid protein MtbC1